MEATETAKRCAEAMFANDAASKALGIRVDIPEAGRASAHMTVREDMVNGFDVCHGGLLFTLADTAFVFACNGYDNLTVAAAASIDFLRPARLGDELQVVFSTAAGAVGSEVDVERVRAQDAQSAAEAAIAANPALQQIIKEFDARVVGNSVKPVDPGTRH